MSSSSLKSDRAKRRRIRLPRAPLLNGRSSSNMDFSYPASKGN